MFPSHSIPSLHAALQIPTLLAVSRVQPRSAPCKPVAPAAQDCVIRLSRNRSPPSACPNVSFPGIRLETYSFSQTCIRSTFLSLNVGRVGSTLFNPPTSCERSVVFLLSLISLSAQSTQSKDHREARGAQQRQGCCLVIKRLRPRIPGCEQRREEDVIGDAGRLPPFADLGIRLLIAGHSALA